MKGSEFPNSPKVELIEFFRPYKSEVNLYVTNISRRLEKEVVQVRFAQRKKFTEVRRPLYMAKCTVLANYYLGFNGWSTRITQGIKHFLNDLEAFKEQLNLLDRLENRSEAGDSQERTNAVYRCVVRLEIKDCEFFCEGTGYGGDKNILEQGQRGLASGRVLTGYI
ncbi:RAD52 motif-containing protein 1 [Stylophora pistillata]|uniref:RAD52 motif-containing protein 1 n=1 Tax=Stylophora pistillata TaxID=50429 RepID=A0A2B4RSG6_STYPI|nr:RAD52 motif-containing protein 1 [Stylophora pistillata]